MFIDRDGTLTAPRAYPRGPDEIALQPRLGPALRALQQSGISLVVVTNQSGLARGLFSEQALAAMHKRLRDLLAELDVHLDGIYACPHHPNGTIPHLTLVCTCRKPQPGMLHQAAAELTLSLDESWMVGDSACDIQAGARAGTRTALVSSDEHSSDKPDLHTLTTVEALTRIHKAIHEPQILER